MLLALLLLLLVLSVVVVVVATGRVVVVVTVRNGLRDLYADAVTMGDEVVGTAAGLPALPVDEGA